MLKLLRSHSALTLFGLLLFLFVFGVNIATFYTDWLWYGEVGLTCPRRVVHWGC